jgi:hypothetical protein
MAETDTQTAPVKKKAPAPKAGGKKSCTVAGCKRAYRAKGLCFFHYKKWRREELEGRPARWETCHKEGCKKKIAAHGLCQEHFDAWKASRKKNKAAAAAAPAAG